MNRLELYSASRKCARAVASITKGKGRVRINNIPVEILEPKVARDVILTPLMIAGDVIDSIDINVRVRGGGIMGQALASAMAISRALTNYKSNAQHPLQKSMRDSIYAKLIEYDKHLLSGDPRQVEPKKFGGPGARRRRQKSYR
jgi:small subunit ribosomal protein S9